MKSKAEVIREFLAGQRVLDLGGCGYGEDNPYERQLRDAWALARSRTTVDRNDKADFNVDLNAIPLPELKGEWDIVTAFDVLEHLEHPVDVLRWLPGKRLIVSLPNALSPLCRSMEEKGFEHLFSFTPYTASVMLKRAGWQVEQSYFTFGKWSAVSRIINAFGSLCPAKVGTGIMLHCRREGS